MNKDIEELIEQAKSLQENMQKIQQKLERTAVKGEAGAGIVKVDVTCKYETRNVSIDLMRLFIEEGVFKLLQEKSQDPNELLTGAKKSVEKITAMLNALVAAAFNDAARKIEEIVQREVSNMTSDSSATGTSGSGGVPGGFVPPI